MVIFNRCSYFNSWNSMVVWLNIKESGKMKIVVKKVPKFLRGIVKLIFGIRDENT